MNTNVKFYLNPNKGYLGAVSGLNDSLPFDSDETTIVI